MGINVVVGSRIAMLRILLILMIIPLHIGVPTMQTLDYSSWPELIGFFFGNTLARLSVPTLTLVSGFLLFSANLDLTPFKLYKKKIITLAVPFFFFNVLYFAIQYLVEYFTGWAPLYELVKLRAITIFELLVGYSQNPLNAALHFLRDLFIIALLAPIFGFFIRRHALLGFVLTSVIFMNNFDGHLTNRDTMPLLFYVGGWLAVGKFDVTKYDRFGPFALAILLATCIATIYFRNAEYTYVYLVAPFAIWMSAASLVHTRIGQWAIKNSKYSFFIFLAHIPLIRLLRLIQYKFFAEVPEEIGFGIIYILTVNILLRSYDIAVKLMPKFFNIIIGGGIFKLKNKVSPAYAAV